MSIKKMTLEDCRVLGRFLRKEDFQQQEKVFTIKEFALSLLSHHPLLKLRAKLIKRSLESFTSKRPELFIELFQDSQFEELVGRLSNPEKFSMLVDMIISRWSQHEEEENMWNRSL